MCSTCSVCCFGAVGGDSLFLTEILTACDRGRASCSTGRSLQEVNIVYGQWGDRWFAVTVPRLWNKLSPPTFAPLLIFINVNSNKSKLLKSYFLGMTFHPDESGSFIVTVRDFHLPTFSLSHVKTRQGNLPARKCFLFYFISFIFHPVWMALTLQCKHSIH